MDAEKHLHIRSDEKAKRYHDLPRSPGRGRELRLQGDGIRPQRVRILASKRRSFCQVLLYVDSGSIGIDGADDVVFVFSASGFDEADFRSRFSFRTVKLVEDENARTQQVPGLVQNESDLA